MMNKAIQLYTTHRYANTITVMLRDKFVEQFEYMGSCNWGLLLPEKYFKRALPPTNLMSEIINEGSGNHIIARDII